MQPHLTIKFFCGLAQMGQMFFTLQWYESTCLEVKIAVGLLWEADFCWLTHLRDNDRVRVMAVVEVRLGQTWWLPHWNPLECLSCVSHVYLPTLKRENSMFKCRNMHCALCKFFWSFTEPGRYSAYDCQVPACNTEPSMTCWFNEHSVLCVCLCGCVWQYLGDWLDVFSCIKKQYYCIVFCCIVVNQHPPAH